MNKDSEEEHNIIGNQPAKYLCRVLTSIVNIVHTFIGLLFATSNINFQVYAFLIPNIITWRSKYRLYKFRSLLVGTGKYWISNMTYFILFIVALCTFHFIRQKILRRLSHRTWISILKRDMTFPPTITCMQISMSVMRIMYLGYLMRVYQIEGKKEFDENLIHCFNTLLAFYVISTRWNDYDGSSKHYWNI